MAVMHLSYIPYGKSLYDNYLIVSALTYEVLSYNKFYNN